MSTSVYITGNRRPGGMISSTEDLTEDMEQFTFACPQCRGPLERSGLDRLVCPVERLTFSRTAGIWRMVTSAGRVYFQPFVHDYEAVRQAEGRGADDPHYYRALPFADLTGQFEEDWRIRATSYRALVERVIQPMEERRPRQLTILDVGAGNCWLANQLAERGHWVAAVDLTTNTFDGLGAHVHYESAFTPVQAEFDRLPFFRTQFDLVIFNASLHYSTEYHTTLSEALRVLRNDGHIVILDSPVYRQAGSGEAMVREREEQFVQRYGFPSNAIPSENYLTYDRLEDLAYELGLQWRMIEPFYGLRWALRPWMARLRRRREPARFLLIDGRRGIPDVSLAKRLGTAAAKVWARWCYQLMQRHRYRRLMLEQVAGRPIVVLPDVFNPALFHTGEFLAEVLDSHAVPASATVLDMGSGSGIGAVAAASRAGRVLAVDINPEAVRCTRMNALLNEVEDRVEVRQGDLFAPVQQERFDVVLFNPPYFRGVPEDLHDHAWRSTDVVERFACGLADHLTSEGYALVVLSSDGESCSFLETFRANGFDVAVAARRNLIHESLTVYRLSVKE